MKDSSIEGVFLSYSFSRECAGFVKFIYNQLKTTHIIPYFHSNIKSISKKEYRINLIQEIKESDLLISFIDYNLHKIDNLESIKVDLPIGTHKGEMDVAADHLRTKGNICICLIGDVNAEKLAEINIDGFKEQILHLPNIQNPIQASSILFSFLNKRYNLGIQVNLFQPKPSDPWIKSYEILQISNICHLKDEEFDQLRENINSTLVSENKSLSFITYCGSCDTCSTALSKRFSQDCFDRLDNRLSNLQLLFSKPIINNDHLIIAQGKCEIEFAKKSVLGSDIWLSRYNETVDSGYKFTEFRGITFITLKDNFKWTVEGFSEIFTNLNTKDKVSSNLKILVCFNFKLISKLSSDDTILFLKSKGLDLILCNNDKRNKKYRGKIDKDFIPLRNTQLLESKSNDTTSQGFGYNIVTIKQEFPKNVHLLEEKIKIKISGATFTNKPFNRFNTIIDEENTVFKTYLNESGQHERIDINILKLEKDILFSFINGDSSRPVKIIQWLIPEIDYSPSHLITTSVFDKEVVVVDFKNVFTEIGANNIFQVFWEVVYQSISHRFGTKINKNLFPYNGVKNSQELSLEFGKLIELLKVSNRIARNGIWFVFNNWEGFNGCHGVHTYSNDDDDRITFIRNLKVCIENENDEENNNRIILIDNKCAFDSIYTGVGNWEELGFIAILEHPRQVILQDNAIKELVERSHVRNVKNLESVIGYSAGKSLCAIQEILLILRSLRIYNDLKIVDKSELAVESLKNMHLLKIKMPAGSLIIEDLRKFAFSHSTVRLSLLLKEISNRTTDNWSQLVGNKEIKISKSEVESLIGLEDEEIITWRYFNYLGNLGFIKKVNQEYVITAPIAFIKI